MTPLLLLFILAFLVSVDLRILAPVLPSISASLGTTHGAAGLAMTSYALAYGVGQLLYGLLSDRHGRVAVVRAAVSWASSASHQRSNSSTFATIRCGSAFIWAPSGRQQRLSRR